MKQHISLRINNSIESKFFHLQQQGYIKHTSIYRRNDSTFSCISHLICVKQTNRRKKIHIHKKVIRKSATKSMYTYRIVFIWFCDFTLSLFCCCWLSIAHKNWCRFDSAYSWRLFQISWLISNRMEFLWKSIIHHQNKIRWTLFAIECWNTVNCRGVTTIAFFFLQSQSLTHTIHP